MGTTLWSKQVMVTVHRVLAVAVMVREVASQSGPGDICSENVFGGRKGYTVVPPQLFAGEPINIESYTCNQLGGTPYSGDKGCILPYTDTGYTVIAPQICSTQYTTDLGQTTYTYSVDSYTCNQLGGTPYSNGRGCILPPDKGYTVITPRRYAQPDGVNTVPYNIEQYTCNQLGGTSYSNNAGCIIPYEYSLTDSTLSWMSTTAFVLGIIGVVLGLAALVLAGVLFCRKRKGAAFFEDAAPTATAAPA